MISVGQVLKKLETDAVLPDNVLKILEVLANRDTSMTRLSDLLELDPLLASRVVAVATSAYKWVPRDIESDQLIFTLLGVKEIRRIVLTDTFLRCWGRVATALLDQKTFWEHCVCVAFLSEKLAGKCGEADEAFAAGLLHDIGIIALATAVPEIVSPLYGHGASEPALSKEQSYLGFDHGELGAWLASRWKLSREVSHAVLCHHGSGDGCALAQCLSRAERIVWALGAGAWGRTFDVLPSGNELESVLEDAKGFFAAFERAQLFPLTARPAQIR